MSYHVIHYSGRPWSTERDLETAVEKARQLSQSSMRWVDEPMDIEIRDDRGAVVRTVNAKSTARNPKFVCPYCNGTHGPLECSR